MASSAGASSAGNPVHSVVVPLPGQQSANQSPPGAAAVNQVANNVLNNNVNSAGLAVNIQQVPMPDISFFKDHGSNISKYKLGNQQDAMNTAYYNLCAEITRTVPGMQNATRMFFNHTSWTVTYTEPLIDPVTHQPVIDPATHQPVTKTSVKDLRELVNTHPEVQTAYKALEKSCKAVLGKHVSLHHYAIDAGRRTNAGSIVPCDRQKTETLQHLPDNYEKSADAATGFISGPTQQARQVQETAAISRTAAAEKILVVVDAVIKDLTPEIAQLQTQADNLKTAQPPNPPLLAQTERLLQEKTRKRKKLEADRLALYAVLATIPTNANPTPQDLTNAARRLQDELQTYIDKERETLQKSGVNPRLPQWLPAFIRRKTKDIPDDKNYAFQAAVRMYSALPAEQVRAEYHQFLHSQPEMMETTDSTIEDSIIRFLTGQAPTIPEIDQAIAAISDQNNKVACDTWYQAAIKDARSYVNPATPNNALNHALPGFHHFPLYNAAPRSRVTLLAIGQKFSNIVGRPAAQPAVRTALQQRIGQIKTHFAFDQAQPQQGQNAKSCKFSPATDEHLYHL